MDEADWVDFIGIGGGVEFQIFKGREVPPTPADWEPGEGSNIDFGDFREVHDQLR